MKQHHDYIDIQFTSSCDVTCNVKMRNSHMHSKNVRHSEFCPANLAEFREEITLQMPLLIMIPAVLNSL